MCKDFPEAGEHYVNEYVALIKSFLTLSTDLLRDDRICSTTKAGLYSTLDIKAIMKSFYSMLSTLSDLGAPLPEDLTFNEELDAHDEAVDQMEAILKEKVLSSAPLIFTLLDLLEGVIPPPSEKPLSEELADRMGKEFGV